VDKNKDISVTGIDVMFSPEGCRRLEIRSMVLDEEGQRRLIFLNTIFGHL
jgi:hypothetical protein